MSFFAILVALLVEQARPMSHNGWWQRALQAWMRWMVRNLDAGEKTQAWLAWLVVTLLPSALVLCIYWALMIWVGCPCRFLL
jgi:adenosylcobinamide-phosphate synthase